MDQNNNNILLMQYATQGRERGGVDGHDGFSERNVVCRHANQVDLMLVQSSCACLD